MKTEFKKEKEEDADGKIVKKQKVKNAKLKKAKRAKRRRNKKVTANPRKPISKKK